MDGDIEATDGEAAGVAREESGQDVDGRGFSGAVRTKIGEDAAALDFEGDAVEGPDGPVALFEAVYADGCKAPPFS